MISLVDQTRDSRTGTSLVDGVDKVDVERLPNLHHRADLEPSGLHGLEPYNAGEQHHLRGGDCISLNVNVETIFFLPKHQESSSATVWCTNIALLSIAHRMM